MANDPDTLEQINIEVAAALDRLSDALASIDAKTVLVVGYAMAAGTFLATQHAQVALLILAYISLGMAVGSAILAYAVRNYREVEPRAIFSEYYDRAKAELVRDLGATRVRHYEYNKNLLNIKVRHWWRSLAMLVIGTALMICGILVHTSNHDNVERSRSPAPAVHHSGRPGSSANSAANPTS